jgi:hypothetical protein
MPRLRGESAGSVTPPDPMQHSPFRPDLLAALFFDQALELPLHALESVVNDFAQGLVHFVPRGSFVCDQLMAGRDGNVDPHPEWIAGMLGMVWMLDHDVAPADVIAKAIEPGSFAADKFLELVRFLDPAIRNSYR